MDYWHRVSREVKEALASRPTTDHYDNSRLLEKWVRNLGDMGRDVICSAHGINTAPYCVGN